MKSGIKNRGKRPNPTIQEKVMKYSDGKGIDHYSFSYEIHSVNQYAVIKNNWDLDYLDVVIFWCIFNFIASGHANKIIDENNEIWYSVSEALIIKSLPLLPINSESAITNRISNLCAHKLIERNPDNHRNCKKYIRVGKNADLLLFTPKRINS